MVFDTLKLKFCELNGRRERSETQSGPREPTPSQPTRCEVCDAGVPPGHPHRGPRDPRPRFGARMWWLAWVKNMSPGSDRSRTSLNEFPSFCCRTHDPTDLALRSSSAHLREENGRGASFASVSAAFCASAGGNLATMSTAWGVRMRSQHRPEEWASGPLSPSLSPSLYLSVSLPVSLMSPSCLPPVP